MKFLLDTNVYIEAASSAKAWHHFEKTIITILPFIYLSSVAAFELGLASKKQHPSLLYHHIESLEKVGRWVSPTFQDWITASDISHPNKLRSQLCDILIAQCAKRIGAVLFTFDFKDFLPLSKKQGFQIRKPW